MTVISEISSRIFIVNKTISTVFGFIGFNKNAVEIVHFIHSLQHRDFVIGHQKTSTEKKNQ